MYRKHQIYVNLTPPGSMDKTIFEAMSSGLIPVVSNTDLGRILDQKLLIKNLSVKDVAESLSWALNHEMQTDLRAFVMKNHSLPALIKEIKNIISKVDLK